MIAHSFRFLLVMAVLFSIVYMSATGGGFVAALLTATAFPWVVLASVLVIIGATVREVYSR